RSPSPWSGDSCRLVADHHVDGDLRRAPCDLVGQRPSKKPCEKACARTTDDDLRDVFPTGKAKDLAHEIRSGKALNLGAEPLRYTQCVVNSLGAFCAHLLLARAFDVKCDPGCVESGRQPGGGSNDDLGAAVMPDADEQ